MHGPNVATMQRLNHHHAKMRVVMENIFGRMEGRWHVLRMIPERPCLSASVKEACIALHMFLESRDGVYDVKQEEVDEQPDSLLGETRPYNRRDRHGGWRCSRHWGCHGWRSSNIWEQIVAEDDGVRGVGGKGHV